MCSQFLSAPCPATLSSSLPFLLCLMLNRNLGGWWAVSLLQCHRPLFWQPVYNSFPLVSILCFLPVSQVCTNYWKKKHAVVLFHSTSSAWFLVMELIVSSLCVSTLIIKSWILRTGAKRRMVVLIKHPVIIKQPSPNSTVYSSPYILVFCRSF